MCQSAFDRGGRALENRSRYRNMLTQVKSLVNIAGQEFRIGCLGVGIADHSIYVVIPLGCYLAEAK